MCREFTLLCKRLDLFGGELVAIDSSKFRAVNSRKRNFKRGSLARLIRQIDEKVAAYLAELEQQDEREPAVNRLTAAELRAMVERLEERRQSYGALAAEMEESGAEEVSLTDPDSRLMLVGQRRLDVCYNVQTAVDSRHKLIVHHEVTNLPDDHEHLLPVARAAKQALGAKTLELVADKGYYSGEEIKKCEDEGIVTYIPKPHVSPKLKKELFTKEHFAYDAAADTYIYPAGERLTYRGTTTEKGRVLMRYYRTAACKGCAERSRCTENRRGRIIKRLVDEAVLERMAKRLKKHPEKMRLRGRLAEHPLGTMKRGMNQGTF